MRALIIGLLPDCLVFQVLEMGVYSTMGFRWFLVKHFVFYDGIIVTNGHFSIKYILDTKWKITFTDTLIFLVQSIISLKITQSGLKCAVIFLNAVTKSKITAFFELYSLTFKERISCTKNIKLSVIKHNWKIKLFCSARIQNPWNRVAR